MKLHYLTAFISGLIFSIGLTLSGMTHPHKVYGFLNFFGEWDLTLVFVMVGAIAVHSLSLQFTKTQKHPVLDTQFHIPAMKTIDKKLVVGAVLFGAGWALAGLCPGPALVSLITGSSNIIYFVLAMFTGSVITRKFR